MDNTQPIIVYVTAANTQEALTIATALVEQRLAACANILPAVHSVFHWDSMVQHSEECVFLLKSTQDCFDSLCETVRALHSYTTPCIVAVPLAAGEPNFLQWLYDATHPPTSF